MEGEREREREGNRSINFNFPFRKSLATRPRISKLKIEAKECAHAVYTRRLIKFFRLLLVYVLIYSLYARDI